MNLGKGRGAGVLQARDGSDGNPIRGDRRDGQAPQRRRLGLPAPRLGCRTHLAFGPGSVLPASAASALAHLLRPSLFSLPLFLSFLLLLFPGGPSLHPSSQARSLSGDGSPAHILPCSREASPRRPGSRKPAQRPAPQMPPVLGRRRLPLREAARGSPGDHVQRY